MIKETQERFPLRICSFDKGFHSPSNQKELKGLLDFVCLPKKRKLSQFEVEIEYSEEFKKKQTPTFCGRISHALEIQGLDRCPDHGLESFKRYVALAVLARNVQHLGALLQKQEKEQQKPLKIDTASPLQKAA